MKNINVGIDLGTTYSAVASFSKEQSKVEVYKNSLGTECTPSVICFDGANVVIGEDAKEEQKSGNVNTIAFYKSMMGNPNWSAYLNGEEYNAEQLSGIFLKELVKDIEQTNDVHIEGAVITVPAYFNDKQREATIRAGQQAGLRVLKIINEPTAAIIAYGLTSGKDKNVMVYDLGGGTFDVTVAHVSGTKINVLATNGNHQLGGKDWDETLINDIKERFYDEHGVSLDDHPEDLKELQVKCEEAKKRLSAVSSTQIAIQSEGFLGKYTVSREEFDDKTYSLLYETILLINSCFEEISETQGKSFGWSDIDEVVLVGGSTRMPQVKDMIIKEYGKPPITKDINVDTIVATGAAMQAELCVSNTITLTVANKDSTGVSGQAKPQMMSLVINNSDIQDITAHGLGILVYNNDSENFENSIIIKKGSLYNQYFDREYYVKNGSIELYILQGDVSDPFECDMLGKYIVDCSQAKTQIKVTVSLCYNSNGVVEAKATDENGYSLNVKRSEINISLDDLIKRLKEEQEKNRTPYTKWAGVSNIPSTTKDKYGNPMGSDYDLVLDNAFANYKILIILASNIQGEPDFTDAIKALNRKGFAVKIINALPSIQDLKREIYDYCQTWIISGWEGKMTEDYVSVFEKYFKDGHGLYLWGDNDPYFVDVNPLVERLFGTKLLGNDYGDKVLGIQKGAKQPGIIADHLITTGLVNFYEGITISHVEECRSVEPLMYNSDSKVVAAFYDKQGKRAIIDGGFTRLYFKWDTAGTDRYVVNAAAWLVNIEKFGYSLK